MAMENLTQYLLVLLGAQNLVVTTAGLVNSGEPSCKCAPDQWSGILSSVERHYDLQGGQTAMSESTSYIHYDYTNQVFAMEDLSRGSEAIADYKQVRKITI